MKWIYIIILFIILFLISRNFIEPMDDISTESKKIEYGLKIATAFELKNSGYEKFMLIKIPKDNGYEIGIIFIDNLLKLYREMYKNKDNDEIKCLKNLKDEVRIRNCKFNHEWTLVKNVEAANDMDYNIMKPWMDLYNVQRDDYMLSAITNKENYGGILYVDSDELKISPEKIDSVSQGYGSIKIEKNNDDSYKLSIFNGKKYLYFGISNEIIFYLNFPVNKIKLLNDPNDQNIIKFSIGKTNKNEKRLYT